MSPLKSKHPCNYPNCRLITATRFCPEHEKLIQKKYEEERKPAHERGYDATWHRISKLYLKEFPLCVECERKGMVSMAMLVHHIKPISKGGDKRQWENLESLCERCHDEKHKEERWKR